MSRSLCLTNICNTEILDAKTHGQIHKVIKQVFREEIHANSRKTVFAVHSAGVEVRSRLENSHPLLTLPNLLLSCPVLEIRHALDEVLHAILRQHSPGVLGRA